MLPPLSLNACLRLPLIKEALRPVPPGSPLLEIGAGRGAIGARLARTYDYLGVEPDHGSATAAQAAVSGTGGQVLHAGFEGLERGRRFAAVVAFEVLEHLEDDAGALRDWRARLEPAGTLVVSVPAHAHRFGVADAAVGHYRRYGRSELSDLVGRAGFVDVVLWQYGFPLGYALEWARNALLARKVTDSSLAERTAASGRRLQPQRQWLGPLLRLFVAPFVVLQRPFRSTNLGPGIVLRARVPGPSDGQ